MSYNPEKGLSQIGIFHYSSALAHALWQQRPRILSNMPQFPFSDEVLGWDPRIHSGEDNLRWSWLRAVEWGRWPIFLSQPLAPVLLIWWPWHIVVVTVFVANCLWA